MMDTTNKTNEATVMHVRTDLGMGGEDEIALVLVSVAVETDYNMDGTLKAYWVQIKGDYWGAFLHAESRGKAKQIFLQGYPFLDKPAFTDVQATRVQGADLLDMTPFTDDTLRLAGYLAPALGEDIYVPDSFLHECPCSMCKLELSKPGYRVGTTVLMAEVQ
jgi:hypothetical protein